MSCSRTLLALVLALASGSVAHALYGGAEAATDTGDASAYFDFRAAHASGSCSGVLIAPRAVLTAAHCLQSTRYGAHRIRAVRIGNPRGRTERATVVRALAHPRFDVAHPESGFDVAVLLLERDVTGHVPIRMATATDDPSAQGTRLRIDGFGLTRRGRSLVRSRALRTASLEYLSPYHCFSGDVDSMAVTRMCAASPDAGVCPGDSGSGAIALVDGAEVVVGIVSLAIDASTCVETAAVLTRVSAMREWVLGAIAPP